jgi:very-short-patch-repair endonuclease
MTLHYNKVSQRHKRRALRNNATAAERRLWRHLQRKQLGAKFRRQYGVDAFVVDFYSPSCKLAIEVDGDSHSTADGIAADTERTSHLARFGISVVRFTNAEITDDLDGVLQRIAAIVQLRRQPPLAPPWKGGEADITRRARAHR